MQHRNFRVHAVLQGGGDGERLRPLTDDTPKPMLSVGGVPMVERLLRLLIRSDIRRVTVITGRLGNITEDYLSNLDDLPDDLDMDFVRETERRGNFGLIGQLPITAEFTLTAFADLVTDLNFADLLRIYVERGNDATLATHIERHRLQLGEVIAEGDVVSRYHEKPLKDFLICSGIGVFRTSMMSVINVNKPTGISDFICDALHEGYAIDHWLHGAFWMDINSSELLDKANRMFANGEITMS